MDDKFSVLSESRKDGCPLAMMNKPFKGNWWTDRPGNVGKFSMKEAL